MSAHTYRFYARLSPGDCKPSTWCGDVDGPNVYRLRNHWTMVGARVHAAWRNWRRSPALSSGDATRPTGDGA